MEDKSKKISQRDRFVKLSLKKHKKNVAKEEKRNRSSDVIILDESFDKFRSDFPRRVTTPKIYSPIVINDSSELSTEDIFPSKNSDENDKAPSKCGNVTLNSTIEDQVVETNKVKPSTVETWSPAQNIISATPRQKTIPSTPQDEANESLEQCSMKKILESQKKILDDLYGETWKSIPSLFKSIMHKHDNMNGVSKKLQFDEDDSDKENIRMTVKKNKELYLTASDVKKPKELDNTEKKSKKKLYTEKIPSTPSIPTLKATKNTRNASTTVKKKTNTMSVTELVENMKNDVDDLTKKVQKVTVTSKTVESVKRLSFVGSLADNVPSWRCNIEAMQYIDNYKTLREQLTRRLFVEFNKGVFGESMDADMPIMWDSKLRSTAGTTTNRLIKNSKGDRLRTSSIKLSTKVLDGPQRLRDTLIHELCHAATWLLDGELRAGHGPLWKKWARRALQVYPELGDISRCHDLEIHFKYSYKCTKCGYSIQRHSKSIDITKKCCGYCRGQFEVIVNRKKKDGVVVSTPARKGGPNDFALYVKENYASMKEGKTHAQVMKILGEQFSAKKSKPTENEVNRED